MVNMGKEMISEFSPAVLAQLNYYVYRLIDPRNGQTFYVGKGKGNRVFQHIRCAIKYYEGSDSISDDDPNKLRIIREIQEAGLNVIHVIQRWNLTEKEAFEVEAALIDAFPGLSNIQKGHYSDNGVTNAILLENKLNIKEYDEPDDFKYMIIKVHEWRIEEVAINDPSNARYNATRWCWRIKPRSTDVYKYVFSVTDGIVKEVYEIKKWVKVHEEKRYAFEGTKAPDSVRNRFLNKRIPKKYCKKGMASPVLFSKN